MARIIKKKMTNMILKKKDAKKIAIIVPTESRPACIKSLVDLKIFEYTNKNIELIIYDSSKDLETARIINKYENLNLNLTYEKYCGELERAAIDKKVFAACLKYSSLFDYLMFCSDRVVVNFEKMYETIIDAFDDGFDFIVYDNGKEYRTEYSDCVELLNDWGWRMTSLSSVIFSSRFLKRAMSFFSVDDPRFCGLWLMSSIFFTIANESFRAKVICHPGLWVKNTNGMVSFWRNSKNTIWQWSYVWCNVIDALPEKYDRIKVEVILSHDEKTGIYSYDELLKLKRTGDLTLKVILKYIQYIRRTSSISVVWFFIAVLFPDRVSMGILRRLFQFLKRNGMRL